ncbi:hypothetical protein [Amycolatopsis sp. NPDC059657]|uniref:hypothetical protein n=1 Tax=Amycolatopsis sp. NPDC059657 TaxID=3346899 RepID=UPI00366BA582
MKKTLGRFAVLTAISGALLASAAGMAAADRPTHGTYGTEWECERAAATYRSSDVGAECKHVPAEGLKSEYWALYVWSIGG